MSIYDLAWSCLLGFVCDNLNKDLMPYKFGTLLGKHLILTLTHGYHCRGSLHTQSPVRYLDSIKPLIYGVPINTKVHSGIKILMPVLHFLGFVCWVEFKLSLLNCIDNDKTLWLNYSKRHAFQVTTFVFAVQYF